VPEKQEDEKSENNKPRKSQGFFDPRNSSSDSDAPRLLERANNISPQKSRMKISILTEEKFFNHEEI
jgi:hypothetical protein